MKGHRIMLAFLLVIAFGWLVTCIGTRYEAESPPAAETR